MDIPAHAPPSTKHADETLGDYLADQSRVPAIITRNPKVAGTMFETYLQAAVLAGLLGKPRDVAASCLALALDAGVAAFQLAGAAGTSPVTIAGQPLVLPRTGATDSTHPATWQRVFGLALALRRPAATEILCAFDPNVFRGSSAQVDESRYAAVAALQAFWRGTDWRAAALRSGQTDLALLNMLAPLEARDAAAFNGALAAALEAHREHWGSKRWAGEVIGWIAAAPLGLAALALDRGMVIDVTSGYLPDWLMRP